MKHLYLTFAFLAIAGSAVAQTSEPQIYDIFQANQISGNGEWMIGRSNSWVDPDDGYHYKESSIINVKTGELYGTGDLFTLTPFSRAISSKGIAIQSTYDVNTNGMDVPYLIVPGQEPIQLLELYKTGPYARHDCYAVAINDDATMFLGYYEQFPIQYPFICNINSDYSIGEPEYLPLPSKDIFGDDYFYVELTAMSDDGNTIAGMVVSVIESGAVKTLPIVYKRTSNGGWTFSYPVEKMIDFTNPDACISFYDPQSPQVALSPDGKLFACTQAIETNLNNFDIYKVWTVDLTTGEINIIQSENPDIVATRILNDGTVIGTFFATINVSYVWKPGYKDFVDFITYVDGLNPEYGTWMKDNLMQTVIDVDNDGQQFEVEMPVTGQVFVSDDMSTFCAGFMTYEYDEWYNNKLWSYVFTDFKTSGITAAEVVKVENNDVYNLQGLKVASNASAEEINNLPAGIYIINGKKVAIRK